MCICVLCVCFFGVLELIYPWAGVFMLVLTTYLLRCWSAYFEGQLGYDMTAHGMDAFGKEFYFGGRPIRISA